MGLQEQLKERSKRFAVRIVQIVRILPKSDEARTIGRQLFRSATSIAANYRAACRSRSRAEFVAKIGIVVEEADETVFWLELLRDAGILDSKKLAPELKEANELLAIFAASQITAKRNSLNRRVSQMIQ